MTPPTFASPVQERPQALLALPADTLRKAPAGAEELFMILADAQVDGGTLAPATEALRVRLAGQRVRHVLGY